MATGKKPPITRNPVISFDLPNRTSYITRMENPTRDHGIQPLDHLMNHWAISNHDLVEGSVEQLNHKQVQKARKGRQLTLHMMMKITRTLNELILTRLPKDQRESFQPYIHRHLFSYSKGHDPAWQDPNQELMPR